MTRKNDDLEKKLKFVTLQNDQNHKVGSNSEEIDKLKLKIISLEKQNEFLIAKSKAQSKKVLKKKKKGVVKKKKKAMSKNKEEIVVKETEGTPSEKAESMQEIDNKDEKNESKADYSDDDDSGDEDDQTDKENDNGIINIPSGPANKGKKKTGGRKKVAQKIETILVRINKIFLDSLLNDTDLQSSNPEKTNCSLYKYTNYSTFLKLFLDLVPKFKNKNNELLGKFNEFFSKLLHTLFLLLTSKSKVHFNQSQEHVGRPNIFPYNFQTNSLYWNRYLTKMEKGRKAVGYASQDKVAKNPLNHKLLI